MYEVVKNGKRRLEADACGIGFLASRKGVAERDVVERAVELCACFDHRGAAGHGSGFQIDIPWPLLLDRFSGFEKLIAQRDVALGMFFLPYDGQLRRRCVEEVEELANLVGATVLGWADVPIDPKALPPNIGAHRTLPVVRQALFRRPDGMGEEAWFNARYLLRLALDNSIGEHAGDEFSVVSLSNRTVNYKGLVELSRIADFYPDLRSPECASRYALFHSRYCTNTTTAWRRAQPFWALAHNGEIATIRGNVAWMEAIGRDLVKGIAERYPALAPLAVRCGSVVCSGGSDSANLDDMLIALLAGGMTITQAILALLPEASTAIDAGGPLADFYKAMSLFLGACDGPAAVVACDGDEAVAHLDRNGLRPLWVTTTADYAFAASELTGTFPAGPVETQRLLGPGETFSVVLATGEVRFNDQVYEEVARKGFPNPNERVVVAGEAEVRPPAEDLPALQVAFGMTKEDVDVVLEPLFESAKPAVGSMGDDTPPAAMLDELPRRPEDYFKLRFAQETSPPIDPIRDEWVFDPSVMLGDRSGLWNRTDRTCFFLANRILHPRQVGWLLDQPQVVRLNLTFRVDRGEVGLEKRLDDVVLEAVEHVDSACVLVVSDSDVDSETAAAPMLRAVSRIHSRLVSLGVRHRVGLVADAGAWDIHHCAILVAVGADAVCPWLGCATAAGRVDAYLKGLRSGFVEAMSMMGVTPSSAYCGARLIEAIGLDEEFVATEFPGVPTHLGGIGAEIWDAEWLSFHRAAFGSRGEDKVPTLVDAGEFRHTKNGRPHANNAEIVRALHTASGYQGKLAAVPTGSREAYRHFSAAVSNRRPVTLLDSLAFDLASREPIPLEEVEPVERILWRFMAPGMSEGALSEPAHRAVARAMNVVYRYCRIKAIGSKLGLPPGVGPIANSGEGGFDKARMGRRDGNASVQYAGGRFTITPMTAARAREAEVKFAQGAKPGKGGQLPGKKVGPLVAQRRGCEPGYELVSPPINHNLYSIEDVKLMLESWRHLYPEVQCALKFVATYGVEMVCLGGVNAGATRLHISDGCGGTGAAKRVDQKHAGVPLVAVLPTIQDALVEENVRHRVELSVDGGVQNGEQVLKLVLLGADRVGFGTSLLISIGCSMLRKCHLAGVDPADPNGVRRLGCQPGVATQDPVLVAKFTGRARHIARYLVHVAEEVRELMAAMGIRQLGDVVGRRNLLERRADLEGKAAKIDFGHVLNAPHGDVRHRNLAQQRAAFMPALRQNEIEAAHEATTGATSTIYGDLTNSDRCVGVGAAGVIAREFGDLGLPAGGVHFRHRGAAGHFYAAYMVDGMTFELDGLAADSCMTAAYGGWLVIRPTQAGSGLTVVGNTFGYGARGGRAYLAGRGGNRFGICFRKNHEGGGPRVVVEGVEANAFQYMTGGVVLVLGPTGRNLGAGMTGGVVYLLDHDPAKLNSTYVRASRLSLEDEDLVLALLNEHVEATGSTTAKGLLAEWNPTRFVRVATSATPEEVD